MTVKLQGEDREQVRVMYERGATRPAILSWLTERGYTGEWARVTHIASEQGWTRDPAARWPRIPAPSVPRWNEAPRINEDVVCLLDAHTPYHDARFIEQVCEVAEAWGVQRCVMDEDGFDVNWLSWFERDGMPPDQEIRAWEDLTTALLGYFPHGIDVHAGNHGERVRRAVRNMSEDARNMLGLIVGDQQPIEALYIKDDRIRLTPYHYVRVHGVLVGHPSSTGTQVGLYVMETYDTDCVLGHTHYAGTTYDRADRHQAVEVGGCFDPRKLKYVSCRLPARARGRQRQGAAIIKEGDDGRPHIYHLRPKFTDFKALARLYAKG
jgi:predicted SpoU family rRNA methylase